uniref:Uncharacterized protein n=1 Tax=Schizaphis graminum TaxID=13262 RepID=A0A2S2PAJ2_SCHGA
MDKSSTKNRLMKYLFTKTIDIKSKDNETTDETNEKKRKIIDQNSFINNDYSKDNESNETTDETNEKKRKIIDQNSFINNDYSKDNESNETTDETNEKKRKIIDQNSFINNDYVCRNFVYMTYKIQCL